MDLVDHTPQIESVSPYKFKVISDDTAINDYSGSVKNIIEYTYNEAGHIVEAGNSLLQNDHLHIEIDEHGGKVKSMFLKEGDLFIPIIEEYTHANKFNLKGARGSKPINIPQISSDPKKQFPFHGELEKVKMNLRSDLSDSSTVVLSLSGIELPADFKMPRQSMIYVVHELSETALSTSVQVFNFSRENAFDLAPGMHPYFTIPLINGLTQVESLAKLKTNIGIASEDLNVENLLNTLHTNAMHNGRLDPLEFATGTYRMKILPVEGFGRDAEWWVWTDSNYRICFEPTNSGSNSRGNRQKDYLQVLPESSGVFSVRFEIMPIQVES